VTISLYAKLVYFRKGRAEGKKGGGVHRGSNVRRSGSLGKQVLNIPVEVERAVSQSVWP
jgi:hypothetical protein